MKNAFITAAFVLVSLGGGSLIGTFVQPGDWYAALNKPWFNPPNWVFGPVWSVLYILIGWAGSRVWIQDRRGAALRLWGLQMFFNFLWTPVFFGAQQIGLALVVLAILLGLIGAFIVKTWRVDRVSASLFLPYGIWVFFAGALNASLFILN